jgi:hypothetical protein
MCFGGALPGLRPVQGPLALSWHSSVPPGRPGWNECGCHCVCRPCVMFVVHTRCACVAHLSLSKNIFLPIASSLPLAAAPARPSARCHSPHSPSSCAGRQLACPGCLGSLRCVLGFPRVDCPLPFLSLILSIDDWMAAAKACCSMLAPLGSACPRLHVRAVPLGGVVFVRWA